MDVIVDRCTGLDGHEKSVVACVRTPGPGRRKRDKEVRTFETFTDDLARLRRWLINSRSFAVRSHRRATDLRLDRRRERGRARGRVRRGCIHRSSHSPETLLHPLSRLGRTTTPRRPSLLRGRDDGRGGGEAERPAVGEPPSSLISTGSFAVVRSRRRAT